MGWPAGEDRQGIPGSVTMGYSAGALTGLLLVGVATVTLMLKAGDGLYRLIPATTASLLGGMASAWLFLVKVTG